jgi:hypothetical protein
MQMSSISSVIDKVKKLLALSKSSNANEAAAAAAAANKLIDQHRLAESELETSDDLHEDIFEDSDPLYESGRLTQWKSSLACHLAKHYGCAIYNNKGYRKNNYKLVGRKSDIEVVRYMFTWLSLEIDRLSDDASRGRGFDRSAGKIFSNSFCSGTVAGISSQLESSRKEVAQAASSVAMVRLNQRLSEAMSFMNGNHKLKKSNSFSGGYLDRNAYEAGKVRGQSIHLGAGLNAAKGVRLLGS